jgi:membrane protease YdiL (CAAX protease family)
LAQILSILMAWLVIRLIVGKEWPRILALHRPSLAHLFLALIGLPGLILVGMSVDALAKQVLPSIFDLEDAMAMFGKWPWPVAVLIIGVGPGIGEELWCRGFLGRGLVGRHGFLIGVLLTSLLFGLIHIEPRQALAAFVIGIGLHFSYLASRSILVPMLLHFGNNSLSILSMHIPALKSLDTPPEQIPLPIYGAGILLVAVVGWAFYQSRARLADYPAEETIAWRPAFAGVEYPPAGSETTVQHVWPDWRTWILVACGVLLLLGSILLVK